jgi:arginine-tRNA-protein transferase
MENSDQQQEEELRFFATAPRACSYLSNRTSISVFVDPDAQLTTDVYKRLARFGFRRSGNDLYVPACPGCSACIPVRVPVKHFRRSRSQRRAWNRNRDLVLSVLAPEYREDHFQLYVRYLASRHPGGGMDDPTPDEYMRFLSSDWCDTHFVEFRHRDRLVAVAVTDRLHKALSAVYTFFDPELHKLSLGTYAILRQIELARSMDCEWLYLGYWIPGSRKMQYKSHFRPMQAYHKGHWQWVGEEVFREND